MSNLAFISHFYSVVFCIIQTFQTSSLLHREFEILREVTLFVGQLNVYSVACTKQINYKGGN